MPAKLYSVTPAAGTYAASPNVTLPFVPTQFIIHGDSGNCYISFDGVDDVLHVQTTHPPLVIKDVNFQKVWVRQDGGAATVHITAIG